MDRSAMFAMLLSLGLGLPAGAQTAPIQNRLVDHTVAPVPFGVGERLEYDVRFGIAGRVGKGVLEVAGVDTIRGNPSYHLDFTLEGRVLFAKVDDRMQSWLDVRRLVSHRFDQNVKEINYERHRIIDFFPQRGTWEELVIRKEGDEQNTGPLPTEMPLDDISFLYFVRTLPLRVGETYTLARYWKDEGNPVTVKVLRREKVKLPAGEFNTVVVQPIIRTRGLFSEGGEAQVYFTDDDRRMLVQLKSKVSFGTLNLELRRFTEGVSLSSVSVPQTRQAGRRP